MSEEKEVTYAKHNKKLGVLILEYDCNSLYHYIIEPNSTMFSKLRYICNQKNINMNIQINSFETYFVQYIIATNEELYGIKLVLSTFARSYRYILNDRRYYLNFIPMFRSGAQKHPYGKIPFELPSFQRYST